MHKSMHVWTHKWLYHVAHVLRRSSAEPRTRGRCRFRNERADDRSMEVRAFSSLQAEERRSAREGAREDAAAEREELARLVSV